MQKGGGGSIIAVSSIQGYRGIGGNPGYAAAKAGLTGAAQTMAVELWQHKIRVNVIYPSGVGGPTWDVIDQIGWDYLPEFEEKFGAEMRHLPLIVGIDPIALGYAALFLASDESSYITGITLPVDAGTSIMHYDVYKGFAPCETPEHKKEYQQGLYKRYKEWIEQKKSEIKKTRGL
jgi:(+)-trans-carveol dehydrogenase